MKRYIYLISPQRIKGAKFYKELNQVLKTNKVKFFQLRLKKTSSQNLFKISKKIKKITNKNLIKISKKVKKIARKNKVKFLINDKPLIAKKIGADGCHIGQKDVSYKKSRKF